MGNTTTEVVLVLGSNEDAGAQLERAVTALVARFGDLLAQSPRLESPASGLAEAPPYLNQAVVIRSALDRVALKQELRAIEARLGRVRPAARAGFCPIDIDLLGRWHGSGEPVEVWDARAAAAPYVQAVVGSLFVGR